MYEISRKKALRKGLCKVEKIQESAISLEVGGWLQVLLGKNSN